MTDKEIEELEKEEDNSPEAKKELNEKKEGLVKDLKLSVDAVGKLMTKSLTDDEMDIYIDQSYSYKNAILDVMKKLILLTGGFLLQGPLLAIGLLLTAEIHKVSKLKNKRNNAKKLQNQYRRLIKKLDNSIMSEENESKPNKTFIKGLNNLKTDMEKRVEKLDDFINIDEEKDELTESSSRNIRINNILQEYLSEDFYGIDKDAAGLEKDAMKDATSGGDSDEGKNEKVPNENETGNNESSTDSDSDSGSDDEMGEDGSSDSESDSFDSEDENSEEEDEEETVSNEPQFGNRRIICDRLLDIRDKLQNNLEILYKLNNKPEKEKVVDFIEKKIQKTLSKIDIVIDKQIDTIEYNKLLIYDVYFKEIFLTVSELIKTLI